MGVFLQSLFFYIWLQRRNDNSFEGLSGKGLWGNWGHLAWDKSLQFAFFISFWVGGTMSVNDVSSVGKSFNVV